jgi:6-phosphogluconolactonase
MKQNMRQNMSSNFKSMVCLIGIISLCASCSGGSGAASSGVLFSASNDSDSNVVTVMSQLSTGEFGSATRVATGGTGNGASLGVQSNLTLSPDRLHLYVCNAGSGDVSTMAVSGSSLTLASRVSTGASTPVSIAATAKAIYILHSNGSVVVMRVDTNGLPMLPVLTTISLAGTANAVFSDIEVNADASLLAVAERRGEKIAVFVLNSDGTPGPVNLQSSVGLEPFAMTFAGRRLFVAEAGDHGNGASTMSSYNVALDGSLNAISSAVADFQTAACWISLSSNSKLAFTTNTGSGSLSTYSVSATGTLTYSFDALTGLNVPLDIILSGGAYLNVLARSGSGKSISSYSISVDGHLHLIGSSPNLSANSSGVVSF